MVTIEDTTDQLIALKRETRKLRRLLRLRVIHKTTNFTDCQLCGGIWKTLQSEEHIDDCMADALRDKEMQ